MKDYDIKIKGSCAVKVFGTKDDTIVVPSDVKLDSDRNRADIDIKDVSDVKIGIPGEAEKIELNITDSTMKIVVELSGTEGPVDINMIGGKATLIVPEGFLFFTVNKGKNNSIECALPETPGSNNKIELNGKDSTLIIKNA